MNHSATEIIPIVTNRGRIVGSIDKHEAHVKGVLHPVIIAELIDSQGNFTLVKQASDRQDPGLFVSPVGGHIRYGESEVEALIREAQEEIGILPIKYKRIGQAVYNRKVLDRQENHLFIVYEIYSNDEPTLNHEADEYKIFTKLEIDTLTQLKSPLFGNAFYFVWELFYNKKA
jgi:isopentenyl-diphosphate Delta-isomerase